MMKILWSPVASVVAFSDIALAQPQPEMYPGCPGIGGGGKWDGMVLFGVLVVALIAALVALTIFLIKRSGPGGGRPIIT
jgi:hypothetical protein